MVSSLTLINPTEQLWLVQNIQAAEKDTTGELRVHLEDYALKLPLERASEVFAALEMEKTKYRNGVLIYVATTQKGLAIIGDMGINQGVPDDCWEHQRKILEDYFSRNLYFEGLSVVVKNIGDYFKEHFPLGDEDEANELPDQLSIQ